MSSNQPGGSKEPFVGGQDRPEVKLDPDTPLSEMRLRDLQAILGRGGTKQIEKIKADKEFKNELKEYKLEKFEHKEYKFEKFEHKDHKFEKFENKEFKFEKFELDGVLKREPDNLPDPTKVLGDPEMRAGLAQLTEMVSGLARQVEQLTNQMAELQKRGGG